MGHSLAPMLTDLRGRQRTSTVGFLQVCPASHPTFRYAAARRSKDPISTFSALISRASTQLPDPFSDHQELRVLTLEMEQALLKPSVRKQNSTVHAINLCIVPSELLGDVRFLSFIIPYTQAL